MSYVYTTANIVQSEIKRNHEGYSIFERALKRAFGNVKVVISHHIVYEEIVPDTGERRPEEIPSADTLWFSSEYMTKIFGEQAHPIMRALILCAPEHREAHVARELDALEAIERARQQRSQLRDPSSLIQKL
jgi:hypothetical protein